jgi:hypothetical protein
LATASEDFELIEKACTSVRAFLFWDHAKKHEKVVVDACGSLPHVPLGRAFRGVVVPRQLGRSMKRRPRRKKKAHSASGLLFGCGLGQINAE